MSEFQDRVQPQVEALLKPGEQLQGICNQARGEIESSGAEGVSGGWRTPTSGIMDKAAVTLKLKITDGTKRKLMMMRSEGPGFLGKLGAGEGQRQDIEALAAWFARQAESG